MKNPRQLALLALRDIHKQGAFTDIALDRVLRTAQLTGADRRLVTELVYGCVRRSRTLDAIIDQLGRKKAHQQPPDFRLILHIGLYQLRYQERIPASAAVNTTVELAKTNGFKGLAGVANGLLRQYERLQQAELEKRNDSTTLAKRDALASNLPASESTENSSIHHSSFTIHHASALQLPAEPIERLGVLHSFPNWIIEMWSQQLGLEETEQLCAWLNQSPTIDLRVNPLQVSIDEVEAALQSAGVDVQRVPPLPQALRLVGGAGAIQQLPGFREGWWTVQDSSAQLVSYLLDPQSEDIAIDACAAPGGKTTHMAELMGDTGKIFACDRAPSRLKRLQENAQRMKLHSIQICTGDSRDFPQFKNTSDRVLLDAPCSGLGTLHRRPDIRWRVTPETVQELSVLQGELLAEASTWVKPEGVLVYATCTLHPQENEQVIQSFLNSHSHWHIEPPSPNSFLSTFSTPQGWIKVWPHRYQMDGFFMVCLKRQH